MPTIPNDQKFHTLSASTPTEESGSAQTNSGWEIYTMADIVSTVGGGGGGGGATEGVDVSFIVRENAYSSIGDHEGTVLTIGTVASLAQVHYWDGSSWSLANAGAVGTASGLLCLGTAANGDALVEGIMKLGSAPGAAGDVLYLNTSNGTLTATAPTVSTQIVRVCGYNLGSNRVYFNPSKDWLEI